MTRLRSLPSHLIPALLATHLPCISVTSPILLPLASWGPRFSGPMTQTNNSRRVHTAQFSLCHE
jgi:hypothetical protein